MPHVSQFDYGPTPEGYEDQEFVYVFDPQTTPAFGPSLLPGGAALNVPLNLFPDVEFRLRGIEVFEPVVGAYAVRLRDSLLNPLDSDFAFAALDWSNSAGPVPVESEIVCRAGATLWADVENLL